MTEERECQNCSLGFSIEPEDFEFYEKINTPAPTWCPACRLLRKQAWREERSLYKRQCDKCSREVFSTYDPESDLVVYCRDCWAADDWDPLAYGRDYDFSRPFFEQLGELMKEAPRQATRSTGSINSEYGNYVTNSKDCYLVFGAYRAENCMYGSPALSKFCVDVDVVLNAEYAYECVSATSAYKTLFSYFSEDCLGSAFLYACNGCQNCFGCSNLQNQSYHFFNQVCSKSEYEEKVSAIDLGSYKDLKDTKDKFRQLCLSIPHRYANITKSDNVTGDDIQGSSNCRNCFTAKGGVENCKNAFYVGLNLKDSHDVMAAGEKSELLYETMGGMGMYNVKFSKNTMECRDIEYCESTVNCSNMLGCVSNIKNRQYCILNKEYSKDDYMNLRTKIIAHMNEVPYVIPRGLVYKYGEYLPIELSPFAYNETMAHTKCPLTKSEAEELGYRWKEQVDREYKSTILYSDLPDNVKDTPDSICDELISCMHEEEGCKDNCTKVFRILPKELEFYREVNVALPRLCPNCRYAERLRWRNPEKLYHRKCQCAGGKSSNGAYDNVAGHSCHAVGEACPVEFETPYSEDRKEIVYCDECYKGEFR